MASIVFTTMQERVNAYPAYKPDRYVSVKRRTWRTLWLVKRTFREPRWDPILLSLRTGDE